MKEVSTRTEILDLLVDVEINPKEILKHDIKDEYISKQLNNMLKLFLVDLDYTRNDFNKDLQILNKTVTNKYN